MNRQPRLLLSVLLLAIVAYAGYRWWAGLRPGGEGGETAIVIRETGSRGGTLVSTLRSEPRSWNRMVDQRAPTDLYAVLTQGKLVRINRATMELEPSLAERWTVSADNLTYTLALREGVTWSDGTTFTSADVMFSFKAVYDAKGGSVIGSGLMVGGQPLKASAPDAKTVVIQYPGPFGPGLKLLDNLTLVPKHKLEAAFDAGKYSTAWSADTPPKDLASIGPFMLSKYESGQRLVFDRNPRYWKKDVAGQTLPYLDQLILEIVPDQNAELVRLQAGQIDLLQQQVRPEDVATLRPLVDQGKLQLIEPGVGTDPDVFFFNGRPDKWAKDPRRDFLTRKEFRQAISHAVDREALANTVFLGAGVPIWGPVTPGNQEWFSPNVPRYPFSIERSKALLAGLGLANRDADEWLEDEKGTEARFSVITYRGNTSLERSAAVLREDLKAVGIAVDVSLIEQNSLIERMRKSDFDSIFFVYFASTLEPGMSLDFWLSSGGSRVWNLQGGTPPADWEREIDRLMLRHVATVDPAEQKRLFDEVQRIFSENLPAIYFVAPRLYLGVNTRVGGLTPSILRPQLLWKADTITVRPAGQAGAK